MRRVGAKPGEPALQRAATRTLRQAARAAAAVERRNSAALSRVATDVVACLRAGGTVFTCGNGGSAADAQHFACELAGKYYLKRPGLACLALTTNTSSLTAIANDFGYDDVFARQLEGLGKPGDVLLAFSTSGRSASVLKAVRYARARGITTVAFTGSGGRAFARFCDHALVAPSLLTPRIQEGHLMLAHTLCELVERSLFGARRGR
jgi:D-sedoheptulose 7-phosphate isomerase